LVIHRCGDKVVSPQGGRYIADHISGAKHVELPGEDHLPWAGDREAIVGEVEEFLTGLRHAPETDRVLATVLFTDLVNSTPKAAALGDRAWKELRQRHDNTVRQQIQRFRGREVETAGDSFLITFDGPGRAVRCAQAIIDDLRQLGLEARAGLHTGEIELIAPGIAGIAVHIAARVSSMAAPSEVLVSSTVKDLVAGSGIVFEDHGAHTLKGVPDTWRIYAVVPPPN
jgi:class 3 adenylate cyclase